MSSLTPSDYYVSGVYAGDCDTIGSSNSVGPPRLCRVNIQCRPDSCDRDCKSQLTWKATGECEAADRCVCSYLC